MHSGSTEVDLLVCKRNLILLYDLVITSLKNSMLLWQIIHHSTCARVLQLMLIMLLLAHDTTNTRLKDILLLLCSIFHQSFLLLLLGEDADLRLVSAHALRGLIESDRRLLLVMG